MVRLSINHYTFRKIRDNAPDQGAPTVQQPTTISTSHITVVVVSQCKSCRELVVPSSGCGVFFLHFFFVLRLSVRWLRVVAWIFARLLIFRKRKRVSPVALRILVARSPPSHCCCYYYYCYY